MKNQKTKSVRLPETLIEAVDTHADLLGLTFSDVVELALRREVKMEANPRMELLSQIKDWLLERYPQRVDFPQDVTLLVFQALADEEPLATLYKTIITKEDGQIDERQRETIHRQIGLHVRRVLDAKVLGRSTPLINGESLIKTHALLAPS